MIHLNAANPVALPKINTKTKNLIEAAISDAMYTAEDQLTGFSSNEEGVDSAKYAIEVLSETAIKLSGFIGEVKSVEFLFDYEIETLELHGVKNPEEIIKTINNNPTAFKLINELDGKKIIADSNSIKLIKYFWGGSR